MSPAPRSNIEQGKRVAHILAGAWRQSPTNVELAGDALASVSERLLSSGEAGLAWWRLQQTPSASRREARDFQEAFRQQAAHALVQEQYVERLFNLLERAFKITPILVKGWSSARPYAGVGARPYGDTDLCVHPAQLAQAKEILNRYAPIGDVDLHAGVPDMPDRSWDQLFARCQVLTLRSAKVRVLGAEDHLRFVVAHLLRHGGIRPLWLCDVAAALEARPADFDWDYCLSGCPYRTSWLLAMIGVAGRLLGAAINAPAVEATIATLPSWVANAILWRWGAGWARQPLGYYLRHPLEGLFYEKLNPLFATYRLGAPPCPAWQLPGYQLLAMVKRVGKIPRWLRKHLGRRPEPVAPDSFLMHVDPAA